LRKQLSKKFLIKDFSLIKQGFSLIKENTSPEARLLSKISSTRGPPLQHWLRCGNFMPDDVLLVNMFAHFHMVPWKVMSKNPSIQSGGTMIIFRGDDSCK